VEPNVIVIHPRDNVAVLLQDIKSGEMVVLPDRSQFQALSDIPCGHKVLLRDIPQGGPIIKYGETIGSANIPLKRGDWVHTHNMMVEEE